MSNIGIANKNIVIKNIGFEDVEKGLSKIIEVFEKEDDEINKKLPHKVLINKTGQNEKYSTEKIIRSLLNLGVPLVPTYEIAAATIKIINKKIEEISAEGKYLSTKDIRKIVSLCIQECSTTKYSMSDIQSWSNKYARRYGHNNRNVEIYWNKSGKVQEVSYDYIANEFLDDIINDISYGSAIKSELSISHRRDMATEILDFINHCDLYRIRYDVLKEMVIEIATQPPHPWIIYDSIRESILEYDYEALKNNLKILDKAMIVNEDKTIPQSAELEILHHASALILGMHNYFFGCYDLTAFYQLKEILRILQNSSEWNDAIMRSKISGLLSDISFSGIDTKKFICLVDVIAKNLHTNRITSMEFACDVKKFGEYAMQIYKLGNKDKICQIINSDWSKCTSKEVIEAIKPLLYSVFPCRKYNIMYEKNYFWLNYAFVNLPSFGKSDFKPNFFVIYAESKNIDLEFMEIFTKNNTKRTCNTILLIMNDEQNLNYLFQRINLYFEKKGIFEWYQLIAFTRENMKSLYDSKDKVRWLDNFFINLFSFE